LTVHQNVVSAVMAGEVMDAEVAPVIAVVVVPTRLYHWYSSRLPLDDTDSVVVAPDITEASTAVAVCTTGQTLAVKGPLFSVRGAEPLTPHRLVRRSQYFVVCEGLTCSRSTGRPIGLVVSLTAPSYHCNCTPVPLASTWNMAVWPDSMFVA
jgi:hypothetical protein